MITYNFAVSVDQNLITGWFASSDVRSLIKPDRVAVISRIHLDRNQLPTWLERKKEDDEVKIP